MNDNPSPRIYTRRLSDKILIAFDQACDTGELIVAHELLCTLEHLFSQPSAYPKQDRRKNIESLVEAHHRLWALKAVHVEPWTDDLVSDESCAQSH